MKHVCLQAWFLSSPDHRAGGTEMLCICYLWNPTLQSFFTVYTVQGVKEASVLDPIRKSFTTCWLLGDSWSAETWPSPQVEEHLLSSLWALHLLQLISSLNAAIVCATHSPGRWGVSSLHVTPGEWLFWCMDFVRAKEGPRLWFSKPTEELVRARKSGW